ncbi:UNVERIFIED_ORG: hypothetical protein ABIB21_002773 [Arthrobacter sp. UYEF13]
MRVGAGSGTRLKKLSPRMGERLAGEIIDAWISKRSP